MIDNTRHYELFNLANFMSNEHKIDIIGVGATGSKIAVELMKLGLLSHQLRIWDNDIVEEHNIANQAYGEGDIDVPKVHALKHIIKEVTSEDIIAENKRVDKDTEDLRPYVFMLVDTMSSRKEIWENKIKNNSDIKMMIDTRMGIDLLQIFTIDPTNKEDIKLYENNLFDDADSDPEVSACGSSITVGPTSTILAGIAVWQFMLFTKAGIRLSTSEVKKRIIMSTIPWSFY